MEMILIYQKGKMHSELTHILGKRAEVSGYVLYDAIFCSFLFFQKKKKTINELVAMLVLIVCGCFTEVSMGILARSDPYNIDYSGCGVLGTRNKNRGVINTLIC